MKTAGTKRKAKIQKKQLTTKNVYQHLKKQFYLFKLGVVCCLNYKKKIIILFGPYLTSLFSHQLFNFTRNIIEQSHF